MQEAHDVRFEIITQPHDIKRAINLFDTVYDKSWKEKEYFNDFTSGLMKTCANENTLRLGVLYIDDEAVSVEMCIVSNKKATFAKSAYDPRYAKYSISSILLLHVIEYVVKTDQVDEIDFGLFDDEYKKLWCSRRRELWGLVAFNSKTFWGKCAFFCYSFERWSERLKQYLKPILIVPYKKLFSLEN